MSCSVCKRDKPAVARGLCNACYQRWRKTGTTDYQRWGSRSTCNVGGCGKGAVSNGLCDTHRKRLERHGHLGETRPDSWGAKEKHPLYHAWNHARRHRARHPVAPEWEADFLQFVTDVGERPTAKHKLFVADDTKPLGPGNFVWKRAITERVVGEADQTFRNRRMRVYRALKPDDFKAYDLKKHYGLTADQYEAMTAGQAKRCAICAMPEGVKIRGKFVALAVDHCHATGAVRALLCSKCNRGLGFFDDDPERLRAAIDYLERHKGEPAST